MTCCLYHISCFFKHPPIDYDRKISGVAKKIEGLFCEGCEDIIEEGQEVFVIADNIPLEKLFGESAWEDKYIDRI
jgi:hypothetical protein